MDPTPRKRKLKDEKDEIPEISITNVSEDENRVFDPLSSNEWSTTSNIDTTSVLSLDDIVVHKNPQTFLKKFCKNVFKLFFIVPLLFIGNRSKETVVSNVSRQSSTKNFQYSENKTTGLIEDFYLKAHEFIDICGESFRFLIRFRISSFVKKLYQGFCLFSLSSFIESSGFDERSVEDYINDEGYPTENIKASTEDGYVIQMHRIVSRKTNNAIFFIHGIVDSSFCWVSNRDNSLAFSAFDKGYDIFMGNFRGFGKSLNHNKRIVKDYWNFSLNELVRYDMKAFVNKIVKIKKKELDDDNAKINVIIIAHSMGAGVTLGYLVDSALRKEDDLVSKAILLSPAGIHKDVGVFFVGLSKLHFLLYLLRLKYIGINSRAFKIIFAKIFQDLLGKSGPRSFINVFVSTLLGGHSQNSPLGYIHNMIFHVFYGTSRKLLGHFKQLVGKDSFYAYDYGKKGNIKHYGTAAPLCYSDHYDKIETPVILVAGSDDRIIPESDIKKHYIQMRKSRKNIMHKFKVCMNVGHIDMTYAMNEEIVSYIEENIKLKNDDNDNSEVINM